MSDIFISYSKADHALAADVFSPASPGPKTRNNKGLYLTHPPVSPHFN